MNFLQIFTVLITSLFSLICVAFLIHYQKTKRIRTMMCKVPGPKRLPIIGNVHQIPTDQFEFMRFLEDQFSSCGGAVYVSQAVLHVLLIGKGSLAGPILGGQKHAVKPWHYFVVHRWLNFGLLTSWGAKWKSRRMLLTPAFHFNILDKMLLIMARHTQTALENMERLAESGEKVEIMEEIGLVALDIISEAAMGVNVGAQSKTKRSIEYVQNRARVTYLAQQRSKFPWTWNDFVYYNILPSGREEKALVDKMHKFTSEVIVERWRTLRDSYAEEREKKRHSFLDVLLLAKEEHGLSFEDIREEVDTFMFEGHDTTAAAISFVLYELALNPRIMERLRAEVDEHMDVPLADIQSEDISEFRGKLEKMKYLDCVIKEGLRVYPSVPIMGRIATEDVEISGYMIPKGATMFVSPYFIHRDPEIFDNPADFIPERWLEKQPMLEKNPYAYIPFSAGPRNCIGQRFANIEERLLIAMIVKNFDLSTTTERDDLRVCGNLILQSNTPFTVSFKKRNIN